MMMGNLNFKSLQFPLIKIIKHEQRTHTHVCVHIEFFYAESRICLPNKIKYIRSPTIM